MEQKPDNVEKSPNLLYWDSYEALSVPTENLKQFFAQSQKISQNQFLQLQYLADQGFQDAQYAVAKCYEKVVEFTLLLI